MELMDRDPHLDAELTRQHFDLRPEERRLSLLTVLLGEMYRSASDFTHFPLKVMKVRGECNFLLHANGIATPP